MKEKYYKREGRRFVHADLPATLVPSVDGMYYNSDGTFTKCKSDLSVGLCIMQSNTRAIVMSLNKTGSVHRRDARRVAADMTLAGRLPKLSEMSTAAFKYRQKLNLYGKYYWCDPDVLRSGGRAYPEASCGLFSLYVDSDSSNANAHIGGLDWWETVVSVVAIPNKQIVISD